MRRDEISILIPVYNYRCLPLVQDLQRQAANLGIQYEIIVADDGSTQQETVSANNAINALEACRFIRREVNVGRSAIRNFLVRQSRFQWLLFLDCDMDTPDAHFLQRYIEAADSHVVDGGIAIGGDERQWKQNLRYQYERQCAPQHTAEERAKHPYRSFRTTNFMARREVMLSHPFDERFLHYGYEDVLFGKQLRQHGLAILHIDNPLLLNDYEQNPVFVDKTEESLRTLHQFRNDLRGYSTLLTFVDGIHLSIVTAFLKLSHSLFGRLERRWLCGSHPNLTIFKLYKLGYYLNIKH